MKILESKRIILRPWQISDLDDLHEFMSNEQVARLAGFKVKKNKGESLRILKQFIIDSSDSLWAVELKNNNKVIGWVELHEYTNRINKDSKEIGCVLSEKYWGQGLMPEALKEVISYGFNEQRLKFIICSHFLNNNQSKRIIEKCGFNYVEVSNEKAYYCMLKNESRFT